VCFAGLLIGTRIDLLCRACGKEKKDADGQEEEKLKQLSQALQAAKDANAAKTKFLATMSHEIRTPMNAIIGLNSIIRENVDNRKQVMDCTEKLESVSHYLLALLNDILDMSRIESGSIQLVVKPFDGDKFWENVNMLAKAQAVPADVNYSFYRGHPVSCIYIGDSTRLEQIMINLINNAIKFTRKNGYVNVHVEEREDKDGRGVITVKVKDNGIGISEEFLPDVFGTFTQEHSENTSVYGGSGLGLSIARNIARLMDGDITVESTVGEGTTFTATVVLGLDKEHKTLEEKREKQEKWNFTGKRVLLAEDHPLNVIIATQLLLKKGFEVDAAANGKEALSLFEESEIGYYDVILMDIRMPIMDGIESAKRMRKLTRPDAVKIPIIAMTANVYDEDREKTKAAGMDAHLAKPIEPKLLYKTLAEVLHME
jgi:CheY-like chemotaxis protein